MAYPTPTPACAEASAGRPTLPLKGRIIAMVLLMKEKVIPTFLPLQGGGQAAGSESLWLGERGMGNLSGCPLCPAPLFMGKDQFSKGGWRRILRTNPFLR
ncbi:MAG: hypothetical protein A2V86_11410 [Deltaproteobacteria bacterium RBG_16_49_23]|nr:MAG: hypothetical protein A2V86_11410 [Deltaproteobacteria bacterium RBG_16_49_23]